LVFSPQRPEAISLFKSHLDKLAHSILFLASGCSIVSSQRLTLFTAVSTVSTFRLGLPVHLLGGLVPQMLAHRKAPIGLDPTTILLHHSLRRNLSLLLLSYLATLCVPPRQRGSSQAIIRAGTLSQLLSRPSRTLHAPSSHLL